MATGKNKFRRQDDVIDQLVRVDEQLAGAHDTHHPESTRHIKDPPRSGLADCLELMDRIRRDVRVWPGDTGSEHPQSDFSWLYKDEALPKQIGRFTIRHRLGMGGFGLVFLAHDPELDRDVALKVPRLETLVGEDARNRFLRESKIAASLAHENIAAVYEAGVLGPLNYIASAYCRGGSIVELLERRGGRLPPTVAAVVVAQLAEAVQHAHSRGILHRDIKPSNIMLDAEPNQLPSFVEHPHRLARVVRLVDFGLARDLSSNETHTLTGAIVGTPSYMAPEQAGGGPDAIAETVDIYALGATLYCFLTGEPPFLKNSDLDTALAVRNEEPVAPSTLCPEVPRDLGAICLKCLEKDPAARYASATALAADLNRFLDGQPTIARPVSAVGRLKRWCIRSPALAAALATLFLVLVAASAVSSTLWLRAETARKDAMQKGVVAIEKARDAQEQARNARTAVNDLLTAIANEPLIQSKGLERFRRELLDAANSFYERLATQRPSDRRVAAEHIETVLKLSSIYLALGEYPRSLELAEDAASIANTTHPNDKRLRTRILARMGSALVAQRQFSKATEVSHEAIEALRELIQSRPGDRSLQMELAVDLVRAARGAVTQMKFARASELNQEALDIGARLNDCPSLELGGELVWGTALAQRAYVLVASGDLEEGRTFGKAALRALSNLKPSMPHQLTSCQREEAMAHWAIGLSASRQGDYALAAEHYQQEQAIRTEMMDRHPDVAFYYREYASLVYRTGLVQFFADELDQALETLEQNVRFIDEYRARFPELRRQFAGTKANSLNVMYGIHSKRNEYQEAEEALRAAIASCQSALDESTGDLYLKSFQGNFFNNLCSVLVLQERLEDALESVDKGIEILEGTVEQQPRGEHAGWLASSYLKRSGVLGKLERYEEALASADQFLAYAPDDPDVLSMQCERLLLLVHLERSDEAVRLMSQIASGATSADALDLARTSSQAADLTRRSSTNQSHDRSQTNSASQRFVELGLAQIRRIVPVDASHAAKLREELLTSSDFEALQDSVGFQDAVHSIRSQKSTDGEAG